MYSRILCLLALLPVVFGCSRGDNDVIDPQQPATPRVVAGFLETQNLPYLASTGAYLRLYEPGGVLRWERAFPDVQGLVSRGTKNMAFAVSYENNRHVFHALNQATGASTWTIPASARNYSDLLVNDSVAYVASFFGINDSAYLESYNLQTGARQWRTVIIPGAIGNLLLDRPANALYFTTIRNSFKVHAVDVRTGAERWGTEFPGLVGTNGPIIYSGGNSLQLLDGFYRLRSIDKTSGQQQWANTAVSFSQLYGAANRLLAVTSDLAPWQQFAYHSLHGLDPANGNITWSTRLSTGDVNVSRDGSEAYALSRNGRDTIHALRTSDGATLWQLPIANSEYFYVDDQYFYIVRDPFVDAALTTNKIVRYDRNTRQARDSFSLRGDQRRSVLPLY